MGYAQFCCSNYECTHTKHITFSCSSRFCPTCGKKATDEWIAKQLHILPNTSWQHITMTMPNQLWIVFKANRKTILKKLSKVAAKILLKAAKKQGVLPGIFTALHTFGRDLKWNTHVHLSITLEGLTEDDQWQEISFHKESLMRMWRHEVITLLRDSFHELELPKRLERICPDKHYWCRWLDRHYQKRWIIHLSKPDKNHYHNVKYIGAYVKRPPLAMSRLKHYDGQEVVFEYLDHKTKTKQINRMDALSFMKRFVQHIPEKGFRMINYYGFLANRVRTKKLEIIYRLLGQLYKKVEKLSYRTLLKNSFGIDPLECILCGSHMVLAQLQMGLRFSKISKHHKDLAHGKFIHIHS